MVAGTSKGAAGSWAASSCALSWWRSKRDAWGCLASGLAAHQDGVASAHNPAERWTRLLTEALFKTADSRPRLSGNNSCPSRQKLASLLPPTPPPAVPRHPRLPPTSVTTLCVLDE